MTAAAIAKKKNADSARHVTNMRSEPSATLLTAFGSQKPVEMSLGRAASSSYQDRPGFVVDGEPTPGVAADPAAGAAVGDAEPPASTFWSAPWTGGGGTGAAEPAG